jgi:hypothetical protein
MHMRLTSRAALDREVFGGVDATIRTMPPELRWLFWEANFDELEAERDADFVLPRVLEHGRLVDVQWAIGEYGLPRIHRFFRDKGHPELSRRTVAFWRTVFDAEEETWASPPRWRASSAAPWVD